MAPLAYARRSRTLAQTGTAFIGRGTVGRYSAMKTSDINPLFDFDIPWVNAMWADDPSAGFADTDPIDSWPTWGTETAALTQGTGAAQPTFDAVNANFNGHATLNFDGTDDYLQSASDWSAQTVSPLVVAVMRCGATGVAGYFFDDKGLDNRYYIRKTAADAYVYASGGTPHTSTATCDTSTHLYEFITSAGVTIFERDGTSQDTTVTANGGPDGLTLAAAGNGTSPMNTEIGFFGLIPASYWLGGGDTASVVAWLADYYGITMA